MKFHVPLPQFAKLLAAALTLCQSTTYAQKPPILEQYVQAGIASNLAMKAQELDLKKNLEAIRQARALFRPTLSASASYTMAYGGRRIDLPVGDLLNPVYATLNQLTSSQLFPQIENAQVTFLPNNFQETKLQFAYPIFNSDLKYNLQIQEQFFKTTEAKKAVLELALRHEISGAYLQFLKAGEAEKIWLNAKTVLVELRRFNESLVKNNVATREVVASADYELAKAENEIFKYQAARNTARAYFNFLINGDLQAEVVADTMLLRASVPAYRLEDLVESAPRIRPEMEVFRASRAAAGSVVSMQEANRRLPDAYVGVQAGFQGFGYHFFNGEQAFVLGQVGLTYDVFNGGLTKSKVQEAKIESEKIGNLAEQFRSQVALGVKQAWNAFDAAQKSWQTAKEGQQAAEAIFKIVNNKYRAGQAILLEFLDAQNKVTTARLQVVLAWAEVLSREIDLKKAAGVH